MFFDAFYVECKRGVLSVCGTRDSKPPDKCQWVHQNMLSFEPIHILKFTCLKIEKYKTIWSLDVCY